MKTKLTIMLLALSGIFFTSCSDDNNDDMGLFPPTITDSMREKLTTALKADFPFTEGKKVDWESDTHNKCYKADFRGEDGASEVEAWYNHTTQLVMTDYDYNKDMFLAPAGLAEAFNNSDYASCTIDDIHYYRFPTEIRSFYEIEVETSGQPDTYLYYRIATNPDTKEKEYQLYKATTQPYIITPSFSF